MSFASLRRVGLILPALVLGLTIGDAPAVGQGAGTALSRHNTNAPVDVSADRMEVQDRANRAIISGNVDVRQQDLRLNAARVMIAYSSGGTGGGTNIDQITATGGVTVRSPSETAQGQTAIYDINQRIITMLGDVNLQQGPNNVRGGRLVMDMDTGRVVMDGGVGAGGTTAPTGRVTGRFTVPQRSSTR